MICQEHTGARRFEDGAKADTTTKEHKYTPVGGFFDLFPGNNASQPEGNDGTDGDHGVELG